MAAMEIINKVLNTRSMDLIQKYNLDKTYFPEYEDEFEFIVNHYNKYGNVPDKVTFTKKFEDFALYDIHETDKFLIDELMEEYGYMQFTSVLPRLSELLQSDSKKAYEYLQKQMDKLSPKNLSSGVDIISRAKDRYEEYLDAKENDGNNFISTSFKEIDKIIGGLNVLGEELLLVFGRTGTYKSWMATKIAMQGWKDGYRVGFVSPEMSANRIGYRFDTLNKHFSNTSLIRGKEEKDYKEYIDKLSKKKNPLFVSTPQDFDNYITVTKLKNWIIKEDLELLIIDGIKYIKNERGERYKQERDNLTEIAEDLMALSVDLQIPIVIVSQANRMGVKDKEDEDVTPNVENVYGADGLAHNCTKIISLGRKGGNLVVAIKKNRDGAENVKFNYIMNADTGNFEYIPTCDDGNDEEERTVVRGIIKDKFKDEGEIF